MPIKTNTVGPGTLTLGSGALAVEAQVTSLTIESAENVTEPESEDVPVLSGETLTNDTGDEVVTFTWTLTGNLFQDWRVDGVVAWSWENAGTAQPFTYVPNSADGASFEGTVKPVPINIGGDVKAKGRSDFTWRLTGQPVPTWQAADPIG